MLFKDYHLKVFPVRVDIHVGQGFELFPGFKNPDSIICQIVKFLNYCKQTVFFLKGVNVL